MNRGEDLNLHEENIFSSISNEELPDFSTFMDYTASTALRSSVASPYETLNRNNNQHNTYNNTGVKPTSDYLVAGTHVPQGSSSANVDPRDSFRHYIDQLTAHLYKYDPDALRHLESNLAKFKTGEIDPNETGRTTPLLYPEMHALAKLDFPGLIYQLIPNILSQTGGIVTVTDEICPRLADPLVDDYPGPLSLERTTEDQILYYLKDQMSIELKDTFPVDWDSALLLINYLELLIKENGKPPISNIVRLLNDGIETKTADLRKDNSKPYSSVSRNSFSRASSRASSRAVSPEGRDALDPDLPQNDLESPRGPGSVASIVRRAATAASSDQKTYSDVDKYREYIMSGRFEEAVNFAMRAGIWDHAFALALRMNNAALVNEILMRFSRRAIYGNDPLFTMHELMAARSPRIVATNRAFSNSEMGDWRSHLSMILAVKKYRPEEGRQAIESMGEKLALLRSFFAAHLCYLLAGTQFGVDVSVHKYRRKLELLGWPSSTSSIPAQKSSREYCRKLFTGLHYWTSAPEQYIKLTEVYEYVLKLRADGGHVALSVHLLPYKYVMTYRMLAAHRVLSAYEYCKDVGDILGTRCGTDWLACESLNFRIVANIRELSYKLHSLLNSDDESLDVDDDKQWLGNIDDVYCAFCDKYRLWNPRSAMPDFLGEQERDSLSDSCSQVPRGPASHQAHYVPERPSEDESMNGHVMTTERQVGTPSTNMYTPAQRTAVPDAPTQHYQAPIPTQTWDQRRPYVDSQPYQNLGQFSMPQAQTQPVGHAARTQYHFAEIPPPSELCPEMIMPSPPRRKDMRTASGSSTDDRTHTMDKYDPRTARMRPEPVPEYGQTYVAAFHTQTEKNAADYDYYRGDGGATTNHVPMPTSTNMFIPSGSQAFRGSSETVDCFSSVPGYSRSRSQSNGSVGSADSQLRAGPRSRNSSESKEPKAPVVGHLSARPLESTKEEVEQQQQQQQQQQHRQDRPKDDVGSTDDKWRSWNPLEWWSSSRPKGVHLPDDSQKTLEFDSVRNKWIDKANPEIEKPPTPPPKMPIGTPQFASPSSRYQGPPPAAFVTPSSISNKYRQATPNVKPSTNASPILPSYGGPAHTQHNQHDYQPDRRDYYENRPGPAAPGHDYDRNNHTHNVDPSTQFAYHSPYDSNVYQYGYNSTGNR